jgi:hypothetical protein
MNEKTYPSDLTDEEWEWIKEVIPAAKSGGRPRTLCMRAVLNAIFYVTDFSVVLFRSDFVLFSEKNRVKVHKNQWVLTMPCPLERLSEATSRGQTMAPEGQKPSQWLCLTELPRKMSSQPIVHKALSCGAIRKSACILAEITIRKSHPLEGSCQEAILIPYTTFDMFFVAFRSAHSTPDWRSQTHPCFHSRGVGSDAPHQSPIRIKAS